MSLDVYLNLTAEQAELEPPRLAKDAISVWR